MPDDKTKRGKPDRSRISLEQAHERRYLIDRIEATLAHLEIARVQLEGLAARLRTGFFPGKPKRGKR